MKGRWKIAAGLAVLTIVAVWQFSGPNAPLRDLQNTRRALREQGFKLELREFDLSLPPELSRRAALLGTTTRAQLTNRTRATPNPMMGGMRDFPALITPAGSNTAIPAWKFNHLKSYQGDALWPELRATLTESHDQLDAARGAAVSGPIRFEPIDSQHPNALLPYLGDMKNLAITFGVLTALALYDDDAAGAWT
ncbi:MAG TPA: hypothetical protein VN281_19105, partial [Verrucomicrobiae bacterium]|nr:hypothetical protein [Verrucomicrobiae bacterium]